MHRQSALRPARCSALRTWARARKKRKPRWPSKGSACWSIFSPRCGPSCGQYEPLDRQTLDSLRGYLTLPIGSACCWPSGTVRRRSAACCIIAAKWPARTRAIDGRVRRRSVGKRIGRRSQHRQRRVALARAGIELVEQSRADLGAFSSLVTAEMITAAGVHRAAGTILGHNMPRLVQLDDHKLEAFLDGVLMVFTHRDVPGIIGRVGTIFGRQQINIAQMAVGPRWTGRRSGWCVKSRPRTTAAALAEVTSSPDINSATVIRLPAAGQLPPWLQ